MDSEPGRIYITENNRFEVHIGREMPRAGHIKTQDKIFPAYAGITFCLARKRIGSKLVGVTPREIKAKGFPLPFAALYLKRNPQWKQLVTKGIKII